MVKWLRLKKKKFTRSLFHSKKREEKNKLQLLFSFFPPDQCRLALAYPKFIAALSVFFFPKPGFSTFLPVYLMNSVLSN